MTNTPERISKLSAAILDMAEQNRGLIKSELDELIFQHCAAAEIGDCEECQPFVPKPEHYVVDGKMNLQPGGLNFVVDPGFVSPIGGWFCTYTGKRLTDP